MRKGFWPQSMQSVVQLKGNALLLWRKLVGEFVRGGLGDGDRDREFNCLPVSPGVFSLL